MQYSALSVSVRNGSWQVGAAHGDVEHASRRRLDDHDLGGGVEEPLVGLALEPLDELLERLGDDLGRGVGRVARSRRRGDQSRSAATAHHRSARGPARISRPAGIRAIWEIWISSVPA